MEATAHDDSAAPEPQPPQTILVVDDDQDCLASLVELFKDHGYAVVGARDGAEARTYLQSSPPPACIVTDLWMPEVSGWTLAEEVTDGRLPSAPLVVVTAAPEYFGHPVPPAQVIRKPPNTKRLVELVGSLVAARAASSGA